MRQGTQSTPLSVSKTGGSVAASLSALRKEWCQIIYITSQIVTTSCFAGVNNVKIPRRTAPRHRQNFQDPCQPGSLAFLGLPTNEGRHHAGKEKNPGTYRRVRVQLIAERFEISAFHQDKDGFQKDQEKYRRRWLLRILFYLFSLFPFLLSFQNWTSSSSSLLTQDFSAAATSTSVVHGPSNALTARKGLVVVSML